MDYPQRKSPRLQDYDYTQSGAYFVTICGFQREHFFGDIRDDRVYLSDIGQIAIDCLNSISSHFPNTIIDSSVVMPNHVHMIIIMDKPKTAEASAALGQIVGTYKAAVSRLVNKRLGLLAPRLWQDRYHDHIVRDENDLNRLRAYIEQNPSRWQADTFYSVLPKSDDA